LRLPACGNGTDVELVLGIAVLVVVLGSLAIVLVAFVWAAREDGRKDRDVQRRLGIRRRTRLGR
jgi:hypothetical protein